MADDRITVICTGGAMSDDRTKRRHSTTQLARFHWVGADLLFDADFDVWDSETALGDLRVQPIAEDGRQTIEGARRVTKRESVTERTRTDGGTTFHLPKCPRCGRHFQVRDDNLMAMRHAGLSTVDLSLVL